MARKLFTETLREALRTAPVSRYQIAKDTGISEANLCRMVQGQRGLSMENLDLLIQYLGLELRPKKQKGK